MQIHTNLTPLLWTFQGPGVDNLQYVLFPVGQVTQALTLYHSAISIPEHVKMLVFETLISKIMRIQHSTVNTLNCQWTLKLVMLSLRPVQYRHLSNTDTSFCPFSVSVSVNY